MKTGPTARQAELVLKRSRGVCEVCGSLGEQIHHRKPRGMGGSKDPAINSPANLLLLCSRCHAGVESDRDDARERGLLVRFDSLPTVTPVLLQRGRVLLTDEGDCEPAE